MESLEKPVVDRVLQAMAQAYPDPVDLVLLSMVMGCDAAVLRTATRSLMAAGLAHAQLVQDGPEARPDAPRITDRGMAVAYGYARDPDDAGALLDRVEACTLRALLSVRVGGSRLPTQQSDELRAALQAVPDGALVDAAKVWAHQPVSDWRALIRVLLGHEQVAPAPVG